MCDTCNWEEHALVASKMARNKYLRRSQHVLLGLAKKFTQRHHATEAQITCLRQLQGFTFSPPPYSPPKKIFIGVE